MGKPSVRWEDAVDLLQIQKVAARNRECWRHKIREAMAEAP